MSSESDDDSQEEYYNEEDDESQDSSGGDSSEESGGDEHEADIQQRGEALEEKKVKERGWSKHLDDHVHANDPISDVPGHYDRSFDLFDVDGNYIGGSSDGDLYSEDEGERYERYACPPPDKEGVVNARAARKRKAEEELQAGSAKKQRMIPAAKAPVNAAVASWRLEVKAVMMKLATAEKRVQMLSESKDEVEARAKAAKAARKLAKKAAQAELDSAIEERRLMRLQLSELESSIEGMAHLEGTSVSRDDLSQR